MYSTFENVNASLRMAWKHKKLWVFALLVAGGLSLNGGGGGGSSRDDDSSTTLPDFPKQEDSYQLPSEDSIDLYDVESKSTRVNDVLGAASRMALVAPNEFGSLPSPEGLVVQNNLPLAQIAVIGIDLLLLISFGVFITFMVQNWANGAFIKGLSLAIDNKPYTFKDLSTVGLQKVGKLIRFSLFVLLLNVLGLVPFVPLGLIPLMLGGSPALFILLAFLYGIVYLLFVVALNYSTIFAVRHIVYKDLTAKQALKEGWITFKLNFDRSLKLTFANCLMQSVLGIVALIVVGLAAGILFGVGFGVFSVLKDAVPLLVLLGLVIGTPLILALLVALSVFSAFSQTYNGFTWSYLFNFSEYERSTKPTI